MKAQGSIHNSLVVYLSPCFGYHLATKVVACHSGLDLNPHVRFREWETQLPEKVTRVCLALTPKPRVLVLLPFW